MLKILIIDDEPAAGNLLQLLIEKHILIATECRYCESPEEALLMLPVFNPSLVMLDIDMPKMNGFDFLNQAVNSDFDVVFTTAFDKYAIKAIRFSALDYLLKPVDVSELQNAINRHIIKKGFSKNNPELFNNLIQNLQQNKKEDFKLAVSVKDGVFLLDLKTIICIEGINNYSKFFFTGQKPLLVAKTIGEYEDTLSDHGFIRTHKSYLVNKSHIKKLDTENLIWLSENMQVPVSRRRKADIVAEIGKN